MSRLDFVELGYVQRAQGLKGEVRLRLYNEASELLDSVDHLFLRGPGELPLRRVDILNGRMAGKDRVATFKGSADRTAAEALVGAVVLAKRDQLPPLGPEEYYHFELIGLSAIDDAGEPIGKLEEVYSGQSNDIYVVRGPRVGELLVPAIGEFVGSINLAEGTITILQLGSLLDE